MFNPAWAEAIAKIESGGNYGVLGPVTKNGQRAYGKYQVMTENIGPWTKEVLGAPMTPEEFRANPQAQDAVFAAKFGQYEAKYGPEGAARAWFGGPGAVNSPDRKDQLGTSVGAYGQKFMAGLGSAGGANNAPAPVSGPQAPMNISPPAQPASPLQQIAQYMAPQQAAPAQMPVSQPMAAPLSAPMPLPQVIHQINLRNALARIPVPTGFRGFRYS